MKKVKLTKAAAVITAIILSMALLVGCSAAAADPSAVSQAQETTGTLLLSVNPEIEVDYDQNGIVIDIRGMNEDARRLLDGKDLSAYEGRVCDEVVEELVEEIYEAGYFNQTVGGQSKNIVIKLEKGSSYPNDSFLNNLETSVRHAVEQCGLASEAITIDQYELADNGYIGIEKAKELVLAQLGITDAQFNEKDTKFDDGVYELEFTANGVKYEYEVNAVNGKVLESEQELAREKAPSPTATPAPQPTADYIGLDRAKEIALAQLGIAGAQFVEHECKLDGKSYDIELIADGIKYDYEVDAYTGSIIETSREKAEPDDLINDDIYDDIDDRHDDIDDPYDDVYDDVDDRHDDIDDPYDDIDDRHDGIYDDADDHLDDMDDRYDDIEEPDDIDEPDDFDDHDDFDGHDDD